MDIKRDKGKSKTRGRSAAKKKSGKSKKAVDLVEVRKDITNIVGNEAAGMAQAVVDEALKGQLAPMKYLFEMAGLYPRAGEQAEAQPEQDSLARTLLRRLGLPEDPVIVPQEELVVALALPAARAEEADAAVVNLKKDQTKDKGFEGVAVGKEKQEEPAPPRTNPVE